MEFSVFRLEKPPTRSEAVSNYVENLGEPDQHDALHIADQIVIPGRPLAKYQVLIPVAAHQEASQIANTLTEYASQQTEQPFSVILSLNSPTREQNNPGIAATLKEIESAKQQHPNLDLRTSLTFYDSPVIGKIRRDLWNGALLANLSEGAYDDASDEVFGFNHDIDLISMSPHYIERVQQYFAGRQRAYDQCNMRSTINSPRSTQMRHAASPDHPGIFWADYTNRQCNGAYEASLVIPLSHYAKIGGFAADSITHETKDLCNLDTVPRNHAIRGDTIQTSPRRYIDRLKDGYGKIWKKNHSAAMMIAGASASVPT